MLLKFVYLQSIHVILIKNGSLRMQTNEDKFFMMSREYKSNIISIEQKRNLDMKIGRWSNSGAEVMVL